MHDALKTCRIALLSGGFQEMCITHFRLSAPIRANGGSRPRVVMPDLSWDSWREADTKSEALNTQSHNVEVTRRKWDGSKESLARREMRQSFAATITKRERIAFARWHPPLEFCLCGRMRHTTAMHDQLGRIRRCQQLGLAMRSSNGKPKMKVSVLRVPLIFN